MPDQRKTAQSDYVTAVANAVEFIESSLTEHFELDDVCRHACLSKFYFSRVFQAMVGETVFDYVRKRRLAEIAQQLVTTLVPIVDLAYQFGYESQQSMSKAFRRQYGVAPGAYRRAGREQFFFQRSRISSETIFRLHRDFSLRTHVFALPALRLAGLRASLPITDPAPVEHTRKAFLEQAAGAPAHRYRGVFEVTLMRQEQMRSYARDDYFEGFIGFATDAQPPADEPHSGTSPAVPAGFEELHLPASRYLTFHYTGAASIDQLSSLYRYIFSSGLANRRERLADRDFFHYYRPGRSSTLVFLPVD